MGRKTKLRMQINKLERASIGLASCHELLCWVNERRLNALPDDTGALAVAAKHVLDAESIVSDYLEMILEPSNVAGALEAR